MKRFNLLIFAILLTFLGFGQDGHQSSTKDSLLKIIQKEKIADSLKVKAATHLLQTTWADNPNFLKYIKICDSLSNAINNPQLKAFVNLNYGQYYNYVDQYDSARRYLKKTFDFYAKTKNHRFLAASCGEMGNSYCFNGDYRQCLEWYLKALEQIYKVGDTAWIAVNLNNIGNVYYYLNNKDKAFEYYKKSYKLFKKINNEQGIALTTNNIGIIFKDKGLIDSAQKYFNISVKYAKKTNYIEQLAETYNHISSIFLKRRQLDSALYYVGESIKLAHQTGNTSQLADDFSLKGEILGLNKQYAKAKKYLDSAYFLAQKINSPEIIKNVYLAHYLLDSVRQDYKAALASYVKYTNLKDSLTSEKIKKDIANLQSVFQLKLAEKENRLLKAKQEKQKLILQRHRLIFLSIAVVTFLVVIFIIILLKQFEKIRHYNKQLEVKNKEILLKNSVLNQQKEEILAQKEEIERQHKELVKTQNKIQESINYAHRIQNVLLPSIEVFKRYFSQVFVLFIPLEVVSGDFFWTEERHNKLYITLGDCTGHGVPGAFISMMVLTMLKDIIKTNPQYTAAQILTEMRDSIKKTFTPSGPGKRQFSDGADLALVILDIQTLEANFAGAYRPMYVFHDDELTIIKGDRQPLGNFIKESPFTDHYIQLYKNDIIYLFSDGYTDQISADNSRKFMLRNFRKLLIEIHNLDLEQQKKILEETFYAWKQDKPQTDDVTVLGLKL